MNRRDFNRLFTKTTAISLTSLLGVSMNALAKNEVPSQVPSTLSQEEMKKLHVSIVIFDGVTALDFIGPAATFPRQYFDIDFVAASMEPIYDDRGFGHLPTKIFADIQKTDILCVPGTGNPYAQLEKKDMIEWIAKVGKDASWVTSVCTGSFLLGAAGLLKGYKASAHWTLIDELVYFGAIPTYERVVRDRNRITGGGVTSGIDFGLTLVALIQGDEAAKASQLMMEYDPQPPFNSGSPKTAAPELVARTREAFNGWLGIQAPNAQKILDDAAQQLNVTVIKP